MGDYVRISGGGYANHGDTGIIVDAEVLKREHFSDFGWQILEESGKDFDEERELFLVLCDGHMSQWWMGADALEALGS